MAQNRSLDFLPVYIANAIGNLFNPKFTTVTGGVGFPAVQPYALIRHIKVVNNTAGAVVFSLYKGATAGNAGGTEFGFAANTSVPANGSVETYFGGPGARFESTDFLTGIAGAATSLTINLEGEAGLSG